MEKVMSSCEHETPSVLLVLSLSASAVMAKLEMSPRHGKKRNMYILGEAQRMLGDRQLQARPVRSG